MHLDPASKPVVEADEEYEGIHTFLPHRTVVRMDHETTKIRSVFGGSVGTQEDPSINNCFEAGSNLNPDLLATIICFRTFAIVWIADINKPSIKLSLQKKMHRSDGFIGLKIY